MKIIKTKKFNKWAVKSKVEDPALLKAAEEVIEGIYDADYGSGVYKKRVANKGRGKSASTRTIIFFKKGQHCFFIYGFEKSDKDNLTSKEEQALKLLAKEMFKFSDQQILEKINQGLLIEVQDD